VNASETWRLRPGQTLQHRQWDGECLLYNDLSGDTHLLADGAIEFLLALAGGPLSQQALAALLEAEFELDNLEAQTETSALLAQLQRLHLVDLSAC
jgi:PqqD family protein of HPr-rel-A system